MLQKNLVEIFMFRKINDIFFQITIRIFQDWQFIILPKDNVFSQTL